MKRLFLSIIILIIGGIILYSDLILNNKYSFKIYSNRNLSFKEIDAKEFNNTKIKNSCFYQMWKEGDKEVIKDIFPDGMTGVIFENCNLDNIYIPEGNILLHSCNRIIKIENDLSDWILNSKLEPIEPLDKELREAANISISSTSIPAEKLTPEERQQLYDDKFNEASDEK